MDLGCEIPAKCTPFAQSKRPKTEDSLAEDAVSSEPLSVSESLIIRENTGNSIDFGVS